jgi:hypothetical protein
MDMVFHDYISIQLQALLADQEIQRVKQDC